MAKKQNKNTPDKSKNKFKGFIDENPDFMELINLSINKPNLKSPKTKK